uniref:Uncharacterized protein n=1 Tax=Anguilla anguilla TaxID=7936 RepID=A0A0E9WTG3_ANGAN
MPLDYQKLAQVRLCGGSCGRLHGMRRIWVTSPHWLTPKWWRCSSASGVKQLPENPRPQGTGSAPNHTTVKDFFFF